jgi:hypothetical protein
MNPLRKLWQQAAASAESLVDGLFAKASAFELATREYSDPLQVHGFYRNVSSDGKDLGCSFRCPIRGNSVSDEALQDGARIVHCGRTEVLDTKALLPEVCARPRRGRYQISENGTQAIPTDSVGGEWDGEVQYEPSKLDFL